MLTGSHSLPQ